LFFGQRKKFNNKNNNTNHKKNKKTMFFKRMTADFLPLFLVLLVTVGLIESNYYRHFWANNSHFCVIDFKESTSNSQCMFDSWSFGHAVHGLILYLVCFYTIVTKAKELANGHYLSLGCTLLFEATWEIIENHQTTINRFKDTNYKGDSILNSITDIFCCLCGWLLAHHLQHHHIVALIFTVEGLCYFIFGSNVFLVLFTIL
jgi:hypothetical protein